MTAAAAVGSAGSAMPVDGPAMPDDVPPALTLAIDIGGSKIAAGLVDESRSVVFVQRRPTPRTGPADVMTAVVAAATALADRAAAVGGRVVGIGVGAPGTVDSASGWVVAATDVLPGWAGTDVAGPLRASLDVPVAVDNDVRATGLAEARRGAGRGLRRVLVVSIGTGVGGAIVIDGRLSHGGHGTTGEVAHLLVPGDGAIPCGCGRRDHLEAHASGPAIAARYLADAAQSGGPRGDSAPSPAGDPGGWAAGRSPGTDPDRAALGRLLPEVVERWRTGDPVAAGAVLGAAELAGRALAGLAGAIDVDGVVVGGGVAEIGEDFLHPLRSAFAESVIGPLRGIPVRAAALGTDAPLIGAAELVPAAGAVDAATAPRGQR